MLCGRGHIEPDSRLFVLIHASFIRVCIKRIQGEVAVKAQQPPGKPGWLESKPKVRAPSFRDSHRAI